MMMDNHDQGHLQQMGSGIRRRWNARRFHVARFRRENRRRPINLLASLMTVMSLYCGVAGIFNAINSNYEKSAWLILAAIIFDMFDGTVARLTNSVSEFGKELDSLCDLVSFGVAPAILIYCTFLREENLIGTQLGKIGSVIIIFYVISGALRLARFNVYQSGQRDSFTGLPIPAAGGTAASLVLFTQFFDISMAFWLIGPMTLALAFLMVSQVRYPKDRLKKMLVLSPHHAFRGLVVCVIAVALMHYAIAHSPVTVMFPMAAAYILFGITETLWTRFRKRPVTIPATDGSQSPVEDGPDESLEKKAEPR
jgi:CDP-diacylglycerol--serine O-phosphatidyltransferase